MSRPGPSRPRVLACLLALALCLRCGTESSDPSGGTANTGGAASSGGTPITAGTANAGTANSGGAGAPSTGLGAGAAGDGGSAHSTGGAGGDAAVCDPSDSPYGINADSSLAQLDLAHELGFTWHRTASMWTDIEWNRDQYDFSGELTKLTVHRERGLNILNQIPVSTPWSCGRCFQDGTELCSDCQWWEVAAPTTDPRTSETYRFVYDLVTFLNTQFSDFKVRAFSGYNEIDQAAPGNEALFSDYVAGTMQPLYLAVHDACQDLGVEGCVVLGPTLSTMDFEIRDGEAHQMFYELGAFDWIDVYDYHPYQGWWQCDPSALVAEVDREAAWLAERGIEKPLWITETGISVCQDCAGKGNVEQARSDYLTVAMNLVSTRPWVKKVLIYALVDRAGGCATADNGWGIYDENLVARPVRDTVAQLIQAWSCPP